MSDVDPDEIPDITDEQKMAIRRFRFLTTNLTHTELNACEADPEIVAKARLDAREYQPEKLSEPGRIDHDVRSYNRAAVAFALQLLDERRAKAAA